MRVDTSARKSTRWIASALLAIPVTAPGLARAEVTNRGTYTQAIDIKVPEFYSIAPGIRLVYDSNVRNGPLGIGWLLQAGSQISRTAKPTGAPRYNSTDQLWLDGMELIPCSAASQSASCRYGGTHATREESYQRITQDLNANVWTVWRPDGTQLSYATRVGRVASPDGTLRWLLSAVTDTHGNRVSYSYACDATANYCYLTEISYGDGVVCDTTPPPRDDSPPLQVGSRLPGARIRFYWEARPDPSSTAIGGYLEQTSQRLHAIDVRDADARVRVYQITYYEEFAPPLITFRKNQSSIKTIQMFGSDATLDAVGTVILGAALPALIFESPAQLFPPAQSTLTTSSGRTLFFLPPQAHTTALPRTYAFRMVPQLPQSSVTIPTYKPDAPYAVTVAATQNAVLGDFDGDRKLDPLEWSMNGQCDQITTRTVMAAWSPTALANTQASSIPQSNLCITSALPADLDADGRTDVLFLRYARRDPFSTTDLAYQAEAISELSNGDGTFAVSPPKILWTSADDTTILQSRCGIGDVNGDGRQDLVCTVKNARGNWIVVQAVSGEAGHFDVRTDQQLSGLSSTHILAVADANGDGLSDLMVIDARGPSNAQKTDLRIGTSRGDGTYRWNTQPTTFDFVDPRRQEAHLLVGQFNGDGRADLALALTNDNGSGGSYTIFSSQAGASPTYVTSQTAVTGEMPLLSIGDFDNDGLDDLVFAVREPANSPCNVAGLNYDRVSYTLSLSDGSGVFGTPTRFAACYVSTTLPWVGTSPFGARATYVNGDSIADLFQFYPAGAVLVLADVPGDYVARDRHHWRSGDINGDGLPDWVYVTYANPGLTVLTQVSQVDGTRQLVREDVTTLPAPLARPDLAWTWFLGDVGGGAGGAADGKVDIVIPDDVSQQIVTLISQGNGHWTTTVTPYGVNSTQLHTILRGHVSADNADVNGWRALDVNGDGRSDLVHLAFSDVGAATQPSLSIVTLRSNGDGTWTPLTPGSYNFGGALWTLGGSLRTANVRAFVPMDINGDGRMDLVQIERDSSLPPGNNAVVFSLISQRDGTWQDAFELVQLPTDATRAWMPVELNGDSSTDLAYLSTLPGPSLTVAALLSLGNGHWETVAATAVTPALLIDASARSDLHLADLDGDGRQDFVFLDAVEPGQLATMVVWNRFPSFSQTTTTGLFLAGTDTSYWQLVDLFGNDNRELVRLPGTPTGEIDVVNVPARELRMTRFLNGMGASDDIVYGTLVEATREMPSGLLPHVVNTVGERATDSAAAYDTLVSYSFAHATFSRPRRQFLGFKTLESVDAARALAWDFEMTDECGARLSAAALLDDQKRPIRRTLYDFAPTGFNPIIGGPNTHFYSLCRTNQVHQEEWETAAAPRLSHTVLDYDDFGNVISLTQQTGPTAAPVDYRRFASQSLPNTVDFIVDRPAFQEAYDLSVANTPTLLARTRYEYDHSNDYTMAPGRTGDLTRVRRWNDQTGRFVDTTFDYDKQGNPHVATGPPTPSNAAGVSITLDCDCEYKRFLEKVSDPLHSSSLVWNKRLGQVHSLVDANAQPTTIDFDTLGRQILVTRPDHSFDRWVWPALNQWNTAAQAVRHEVSDGSTGDGVLWDVTSFDGLGRPTRIEREGGSSREILQYDGVSARIGSATAPHFTQETPAVTTLQYDAAGRAVYTRKPDASSRRVRYQVGSFTTSDERGATTQYDVDPFGRITAVHENRRDCFGDNCPIVESPVTQYQYDALDRLTQIVDAKKVSTVLTWDSLGRMVWMSDPDRGRTSFTWNDDGTRASMANANRSVVQTRYDSIGRLALMLAIDPSRNTTREIRWTWDTGPTTGGLQGSSVGRIVQIDDSSQAAKLKSTYRYDVLGRVDGTTKCVDARCFDLGAEFDPAGRIQRIMYPDQSGHVTGTSPVVEYVYDESGWLDSLPGYVVKFAHDAAGRRIGAAFANRVGEARSYDHDRGWSTGVSVFKPGIGFFNRISTVFSQTLDRDRTGRTRTQDIANSQGLYHDEFVHDDIGRLTSITSNRPPRSARFDYDTRGRLIFHTQLGRVSYKDGRHVHAPTDTASGGQYVYDLAGQMKSSRTFAFTWGDAQDLLQAKNRVNGRISQFAYDGDRNRVKTSAGGSDTLTPDRLLEVDSHGTVIPWIFAEGRRLARLAPGGAQFLHTDALGSTRLVTDSAGNSVAEYDYGAWGEGVAISNSAPTRHRFAGSETDDETALDRMGERDYDPSLAHFISADPTVPDVYKPQSLNRYGYALNDPVTLIDPRGLQSTCADANVDAMCNTHAPEGEGAKSDPSEWAQWPGDATRSSAPPLVAAEPEIDLARHEIIECGSCHAANLGALGTPAPPGMRPTTNADRLMVGSTLPMGLALFGAPVAVTIATTDALLEGSIVLYQLAPRAWNAALAVGSALVGVPRLEPSPNALEEAVQAVAPDVEEFGHMAFGIGNRFQGDVSRVGTRLVVDNVITTFGQGMQGVGQLRSAAQGLAQMAANTGSTQVTFRGVFVNRDLAERFGTAVGVPFEYTMAATAQAMTQLFMRGPQ